MLPAAAAIFRRADVPPVSSMVTLEVPIPGLMARIARQGADVVSFWCSAGVEPSASIGSRTSVRLSTSGEQAVRRSVSDTPGAVTWRDGDFAEYVINSPASRGAVGFITGRTIELGGMSLEMTGSPGRFAAVTVVALDGKPLERSRRMLVSAVGRVENPGMMWNEDRTSVSTKWGTGPAIAEGMSCRLSLETSGKSADVYALDGGGQRVSPVDCRIRDGRLVLEMGERWRTLWYEVVTR
jgi:hypothetical protein